MALSYEEQLRLENSKEHLKVVLDNIRNANLELERVLGQVESGREEISRLLKEAEVIEEGNEALLIKRVSLKQSLAQLNKEVDALLKTESRVNASLEKKQTELAKTERRISEINSKYDSDTNKRRSILDALLLEIKEAIASKTEHEEEAHEQFQLTQKYENEKNKIILEIKEAEKVLSNIRSQAAKEMEEIEIQLQAEKEKIHNPLKLIREETEKNRKKESDLNILANRLRKQFIAQNPNKILPLELQEEK